MNKVIHSFLGLTIKAIQIKHLGPVPKFHLNNSRHPGCPSAPAPGTVGRP